MTDITKTRYPDTVAFVFRYCDLQARFAMVELAEEEEAEGNRAGAAQWIHAVMYLADRRNYERDPAPKGLIPVFGWRLLVERERTM